MSKKITDLARGLFVSAEDFRLAYEALTLLPDSDQQTVRTLAPQVVCATFAIELYMKCILVDAGSSAVPRKHELLFLYQQIPKAARAKVVRRWRTELKNWKEFDACIDLKLSLESILGDINDAFDKWRYRFEYSKKELRDARFTLIHATLHLFLTERHPEWVDPDHTYFQATFPAR